MTREDFEEFAKKYFRSERVSVDRLYKEVNSVLTEYDEGERGEVFRNVGKFLYRPENSIMCVDIDFVHINGGSYISGLVYMALATQLFGNTVLMNKPCFFGSSGIDPAKIAMHVDDAIGQLSMEIGTSGAVQLPVRSWTGYVRPLVTTAYYPDYSIKDVLTEKIGALALNCNSIDTAGTLSNYTGGVMLIRGYIATTY